MQRHTKKEYDQDHSQAMKKLTLHRQHKISNWMHFLSNKIVEDLKYKDIDLLVVGKNIGQKQQINIGKKNNQQFVQLPFNQLWEKIAYKAFQQGILVYYQEESYSSKDNCLAETMIPIYQKDKIKEKKLKNENIKADGQATQVESSKNSNVKIEEKAEVIDLEQVQAVKNKYKFSGQRCKGMYHTETELNIHADVNGSYNIMKKMFHSLNLHVNVLNLQNNHQQKYSRKSLHQTFMPQVWNFKALEKNQIHFGSNPQRVAQGGAFCSLNRLQTTSEENKKRIEHHV